uniref:CCHC-type domain-containing protein n=2 Tax=Caenorhabditis japonica TaxID=281687 RepID=A0A8R1I9I2_CAEJA
MVSKAEKMADCSEKSLDVFGGIHDLSSWTGPGLDNFKITEKQQNCAYEEKMKNISEDSSEDLDLADRILEKKSRRLSCTYCNRQGHVASSCTKKKFIPSVQKLLDCEKSNTNAGDFCQRACCYGPKEQKPTMPSIYDNFRDLTPSPRGLTRRGIMGRSTQIRTNGTSGSKKYESTTPPEKEKITPGVRAMIPPLMPPQDSSEILTIESTRKVIREGGLHFEEVNIIKFPKNLPPNVHVFTQQLPNSH